eukprot:3596834-Prymnesium_polylepis.1
MPSTRWARRCCGWTLSASRTALASDRATTSWSAWRARARRWSCSTSMTRPPTTTSTTCEAGPELTCPNPKPGPKPKPRHPQLVTHPHSRLTMSQQSS